MSKAYKRADTLQEILAKRNEKQRQSSAEKCQEIIKAPRYGTLANPYQFKQTGMKLEVIKEEDLRKEIPGQLEITTGPKVITKELLEAIKDLPINKALTEAYKKDKE